MKLRISAAFAVAALWVAWNDVAAAREYIASGQETHFMNEVARPVLPAYGKVSQSGSAPATLRIPEKLASGYSNNGVQPIPSPSLFQFTGAGISYLQAGTFASSGGPGNFSWCPGRANTVNPNCLFPAQGTGPFPPQRLSYNAGPNQFGGTAGAIRNIRGSFSFLGGGTYNGFATVAHRGNPAAAPVQEVGGGYEPGSLVGGMTAGGLTFGIHSDAILPPRYSYGFVLGPLGTIQTPGKIIGTGTENAGEVQTGTGFAWTTGTISATNYSGVEHLSTSGTTPVYTYWTLSGYDNRTALGAGNIQMVSGGLFHAPSSPNDSVTRRTWTLTLAEKVPSMGPVGFAVATALMILAVGYTFRNRL